MQTAGEGTPNQLIDFEYRQILMDSISVSVDGTPWNQVDYFTTSHPLPEYRVEYTADYNAYVIFGNGRAGLIPPQDSSIVIRYRIGGGTIGNCITGAIDFPIQVQVPGLNYMVTMNLKNYTKAEYGYDGDTVEDIRRKLPLYLRTQNRCVTGMDYKALVDNFSTTYNGQVGKSLAVLRNTGCAGNIIDIYITAREGASGLTKASDNLKNELSNYLQQKKMLSHHICLRDGEIVEVDIHVNVIINRSLSKYVESLKERAYRHIENLFTLSNWEYGQALKDSDIIKALVDIKEVESIEVSFTTAHSLESGEGSTSVVSPRFYEIVRPDNISINFSYKDSR